MFVASSWVVSKAAGAFSIQALSTLLFLYSHVMNREVDELGDVIRDRTPKRLLVVMTREKVRAVLSSMEDDKWLMTSLMYGMFKK